MKSWNYNSSMMKSLVNKAKGRISKRVFQESKAHVRVRVRMRIRG